MESGRAQPGFLAAATAFGLFAGGSALGAAVWLVRQPLPSLATSSRWTAAAIAVAALLAFELTGKTYLLARNLRVPTRFVSRANPRAGLIWGAALGAGLITEAPFGILHASLLLAVLAPSGYAAVTTSFAFAVCRGLVILPNWTRRRILVLTDEVIVLKGHEVSRGVLAAGAASRLSLIFLAVASIVVLL
jgi:hypothetical protein